MRFQTLFRHKRNMMAAAITMVLLYHTKGALPECLFKRMLAWVYGCVDVFFFASGAGCFLSYTADRDHVGFLKRRAMRILPSYLPYIALWLIFASTREGIFSPVAILANTFGVQGFTVVKPSLNWYVSGMWLSYLLVPWMAALAMRCRTKLQGLAAVFALVLLSVCFWGDYELIIIVTRLPIFLVGMLFAAASKRRESLTKTEVAVLLALVPVGFVLDWELLKYFPELAAWNYGLAWYPFLLMVPGTCIVIAALSELLDRSRFGRGVNRVLGFIGSITFEVYLVHFVALELPYKYFYPATFAMTAALYFFSRALRKALQKKFGWQNGRPLPSV